MPWPNRWPASNTAPQVLERHIHHARVKHSYRWDRRVRSPSYHNFGDHLGNQGTGRYPEVEEFFRQAQQVCRQLVAEFPAVTDYRRRLALVGDSRGRVLK